MEWLVGLTFLVSLLTSILSGIGGGGGGFIMTPYLIFIGLSPQQAIATGKMSGIGSSVGAITAFQGKGLVNKRLVIPFMIITALCAFVAAWLMPKIDPFIFQKIIGAILILMIPTLFIKKASFQPGPRSRGMVVAGFIAYTLFSFAQTMIGTGMGSLLVIVLMLLFGLTALEANATKRVAQSVQAVILFVLLWAQGLVVLAHGAAGLLGSSIGSHIGAHIAIKKGNTFVKYVLAGVMAVSGTILLTT